MDTVMARTRANERSDRDGAMTKHTFEVEGMTCGSCVARVENALRAVPGVTNAEVNLATRRAVIEAAPEVAIDAVQHAVVEAGYRVTPTDGTTDDPGSELATSNPTLPTETAYAARRRRELDEERSGVRRAWVASALSIPLLALGMSHGAWPFAESSAGRALQFVLATMVLLGPGAEIFRLALASARHRAVDMNTLIAIGSFAAWAASTWNWIATIDATGAHDSHGGGAPHLYFEAAATILTFVLIGRVLEHRARRRLGDAVESMRALMPETATRVGKDGSENSVPTRSLRAGDLVRIRPGDKVPADGVVLVGRSVIDESLLTGESVPVARGLGDAVKAGTLNHDGTLLVEVKGSGEATTLARIAAAVEEAQGSKAPIARVADRVAARFVPLVLALAALTFLAWSLGAPDRGWTHALERAIAVLVIACPCALGLATPAAVAAGAGRAAELGILFKNGEALETTARLDRLFLDKTGTLTVGVPSVVATHMSEGTDDSVLLAKVAAVESGSAHPLAKAIVSEARRRGSSIEPSSDFASEPGAGASARVGSNLVRVGTREYLMSAGIAIGALEASARQAEADGRTVVFAAIDDRAAGWIALVDEPAPDARQSVDSLRTRGIAVSMLTGDREGPALSIARSLGLELAGSGATPTKKAAIVDAARARGELVGMVGDGVNDAPALARADVGFAMGGGADVAAHAADVTLLQGGIRSLVVAIDVARATLATIRRNLVLAFGYNALAIPLAAGVFEPWLGWSLSPMVASAAMAASSISVVMSSLLLRRFASETNSKEPIR